jgi:hypothetical protein
LLTVLVACVTSKEDTEPDTVDTVDTVETETDTETDTGEPASLFADCEPHVAELGVTTGSGDCVESDTDADGVTQLRVRADCADSAITGHLDKRHVVMVPPTVTQDALWVHLGGSGGQPTNSTNIGDAAVESGYRFISVAYLNEPSIPDRCACPDGPRPLECEEVVRLEVLYGDEQTEWFEMAPEESISHRLSALLLALHDQQPSGGWDRYLTDGDEPDWSQMALSGFSQGGGMAGLIARDHEVERVMYLSKGAGSISGALLDPDSAISCTDHKECEGGVCCPISVVDSSCAPEAGGDNVCHFQVPGLWARAGQDVDGDGLGDGGPETRATPASRQFGLVHLSEGAWTYSPEVFALWGMGDRDDFLFADDAATPYDADVQLFSTDLKPAGGCSEHQSMGANACQPTNIDGEPAMRDAWLHAMTATP